MHTRLRRYVEITELPQKSRWRFSGDGHRLVTMAARNDINVRDVPFAPLAGSDPYGIRVESQLIVARNRRLEPIELRFNRLVCAGHYTYAFQLSQLRVGVADRNRRFLRAHVRLAFEAEHRKSGAFGSRV